MPRSPEAKARQAEYLKAYRQSYRTKRKRVNVTFTLAEYDALDDAARTMGETPTTFLHRLAVTALSGQPRLTKEDEARFDEFSRLIRGIANNLNQMARYSHATRGMLDEREIGYQLRYLEESVRKFLENGGGDG